MRILLTGASGFIGSALGPSLSALGHQVTPLRRRSTARQGHLALPSSSATGPTWDPETGGIDLRGEAWQAVIHLAGETIGQRWTPKRKERIRNSRVRATRLLCEALLGLTSPPEVLVCASAAGIYGDRGGEWLDESSTPGTGFLAEVAIDWERATTEAARRGVRVVNLRLGVVASARGGAVGKMLPAFRLGLGGKLGTGQQFWSWIALDDVLRVVEFALTHPELKGPINTVAPNPVTNLQFTRTLGKVLRRPTAFAVPIFVVKMLFGQMGEEALLASCRARPARLEQSGFAFRFPELEAALSHEIVEALKR